MRNCRGVAIGIVAAGLAFATSPSYAGAGVQSIYSDGLQNGWQPWGWATINYKAAKPVHSGHKSISVTIKKGYDALYLHHDAFNTAPYKSFTFWVNGGAKGGQVLQVQATVNKKPVKYFKLPAIPAHTWKKISVPLSALGVANRNGVDGLWIEDGSGKALPTFYVDDVALTK